jgi:hypothetical protein
MSTATTKTIATQISWHGTTMFWRFVWKEFRMIRGLWLAVALMGFAIQWVARLLMLYSPASADPNLPSILFAIGLAAAVLYTVGAAATNFSVEHEEETYGFLVRLPATWPSMFAGTLLVALVTALLLAARRRLASVGLPTSSIRIPRRRLLRGAVLLQRRLGALDWPSNRGT